MIVKRTGNGQTECTRCKEKGKWALNWDSFLYNFNDKPYCFDCLMEMLEEKENIIKEVREYIENNDLYEQDYDYDYEENLVVGPPSDETARKILLEILEKGE